MSKQYGLIIPSGHKVQNVVARPSIFNNDDSDVSPTDTPAVPAFRKTLKKQDKLNQARAVEEDPTVYQYDEIYDKIEEKRKESKLSRRDLDKKPKYISKLLEAADRRKRENERRIERQVQKEREAEGLEFQDKESFVTAAYRQKLEEMKQLDEQEKREEYLETIGDVTKQGNLDGFYRHIYEQKLCEKEEKQESPAPKKPRTYRTKTSSGGSGNESQDEKEKKGHLPMNLDADSDFSIDSSSEDEGETEEKTVVKLEESSCVKVEETANTVVEVKDEVSEEQEEVVEKPKKKAKVDIWKKRTVGDVFDEALKRYFERKALRESG